MNSFARAGKSAPLALLSSEVSDESTPLRAEGGSEHQSSIRSVWPFGMLKSLPGGAASHGKAQEKSDKDNQELKSQLDLEKASWEEQKRDLMEEQKNLHWQTWDQANKIAECKQELALVQTNSATLTKHLLKLKDRPVPARAAPRTLSLANTMPPPMSTASEVCSCGSTFSPGASFCRKCGIKRPDVPQQELARPPMATWPMTSMPRANNEMGMALKMAEDLRQSMCCVEEKRRELNGLQTVYNQNRDQATQQLNGHRNMLTALQADLGGMRGEKEARLIEKQQFQEEELRLLEVQKQIE